MADSDQSLYNLRYNQVSQNLEGFGGGSPAWSLVTLNNVDPTQVPVTRLINTTAPLTGGGDLSANRTLSMPAATNAVNGYLLAIDWTTFNSKQAAGSYITALTGDVAASGPGSASATLATVNSDVGSFTSANITVDAKGRITAASNGSGGGGTPGGANTQIQFNSSGSFGGDANFTWDGAALVVNGNALGVGTLSPDPDSMTIQLLGQPLTGDYQYVFRMERTVGAGGILLGYDSTNSDSFVAASNAGNLLLVQNGNEEMRVAAGQVAVGTPTPDASARLEVFSTTQGFLPPRVTTAQKTSISSPAEGLMVYDTDLHKLAVWTGATWETVTSA